MLFIICRWRHTFTCYQVFSLIQKNDINLYILMSKSHEIFSFHFIKRCKRNKKEKLFLQENIRPGAVKIAFDYKSYTLILY